MTGQRDPATRVARWWVRLAPLWALGAIAAATALVRGCTGWADFPGF